MAGEGPSKNKAADDEKNAYADVAASEKREQSRVPVLRRERDVAFRTDLGTEMKEHDQRNRDEAQPIDLRNPGRAGGDPSQAPGAMLGGVARRVNRRPHASHYCTI